MLSAKSILYTITMSAVLLTVGTVAFGNANALRRPAASINHGSRSASGGPGFASHDHNFPDAGVHTLAAHGSASPHGRPMRLPTAPAADAAEAKA